jgi:hypothetical protein
MGPTKGLHNTSRTWCSTGACIAYCSYILQGCQEHGACLFNVRALQMVGNLLRRIPSPMIQANHPSIRLREVVDYSSGNKLQLITGCDATAQHIMWGDLTNGTCG